MRLRIMYLRRGADAHIFSSTGVDEEFKVLED
jgi:hypothetical protein